MDGYIRDFEVKTIQTCKAESISQGRELLKANGGFGIFHGNIRSLKKNMDEFSIVLNELKYNFHCIVLTETWNLYDLQLFNIPGYDLIYNEGHINQNDGVVIYIKNESNYFYNIITINEIKVIQLTTSYSNKSIQILAIYRSPSLCPFSFNLGLSNFLKSCKKQYDINILIGDINIDILQDTDYSHEYLNILHEEGFKSMINDFTRVEHGSKSCIDHIFLKTNISLDSFLPVIIHAGITDHYYTILQYLSVPEIEKSEANNNNHYKYFTDYNKLNQNLNLENWLDVYTTQNVDIATELFINKLKYAISENTRKIKIKRYEVKRHPWMTNGLIKSIYEKNRLYKNLQKNPDNINLLNKFKQYRNKLTELIKRTKENYYKEQINKNKNCAKNLWKCINENKNKKTIINSLKNKSGVLIENKAEIANTFIKYFNEVGSKLAEQIKQTTKINKVRMDKIANSIVLADTTETEVKKIIEELKPHKSPGLDNITSESLKKIVNNIIEPLTYLINTSLRNGNFPKVLKVAVIKPLYKAGDKHEVSNYRPISLISNIAKIFEKVIKIRICGFIEKYKLISDKQYGFREARSTQDAIAHLTSLIYKAMDESKPALCIFVDLAKAFDTVSHPDLLETLHNAGFRDRAYHLMKSYLSDREQCVKIENEISERKIVQYGVPQGTVLGPILFTLYINALFSLPCSGDIISFADDTAIFYKDVSWTVLKHKVEKDFKIILDFFNSKLLTINVNKTYFLPFTSYHPNLPNFNSLEISYGKKILNIESCYHIKYLGINIDCHLRWDTHINNLIKKLRGILSKFKHFKNICDIKHLTVMYNALVQSHLMYGIIGWGGVTNKYLKKLEMMQKWIIKIIYNKCYTYPSDDLYAEARILDIRQLFARSLILRLYTEKQKNNNNLHGRNHNYETRNKNTFKTPKTEKTIGQRCHLYLSPILYNKLPSKVKEINSYNLFKNKVSKWLIETNRHEIRNAIDQNIANHI